MIAEAYVKRTANESSTKDLWKALYYFNLYRLMLAAGLSALALSGTTVIRLGERSPEMFLFVSIGMLLVSVINIYAITQGRTEFQTQAFIQFFLDILLLTVLAHASGGISSGLNLLLIVSVAASGVVLPGRMAIFFAALATLASLAEHTISLFLYQDVDGSFTQLGFLGIGLFSTGSLLSFVAHRVRRTQALADRRAVEVISLAKLNELIVARLQTGILVVDKTGNIRLSNLATQDLLGVNIQSLTGPVTLSGVSPQLATAFAQWKRRPDAEQRPTRLRERGPSVMLRFVPVTGRQGDIVAIFLEDMSQTERHAQHLKLAALGRLTAAIAHEIRNPLGAISHASQLIDESPSITDQDRKLTRIINDNSERLDQIIKAILQLGRPRSSNPVLLDLHSWLSEFCQSFSHIQNLSPDAIELRDTDMTVCADPDQLHQVLLNLCQNAVRHSPPFDGHAVMTLECGWIDELGVPCLDVVDRGTGVPSELRDKIFEPFFTTAEKRGTGLGLYLSRALCENNYGRLDYVATDQPGSRFRIQFAPNELCKDAPA